MKREMRVGDYVHAWKILAAPDGRDLSRAWLAGCVCFSVPKRLTEKQLQEQKNCGCGRRRRKTLGKGHVWGTFTLQHIEDPPSCQRPLLCSCGELYRLPPWAVCEDRRAHCLACAESATPLETRGPVRRQDEDPEEDEDLVIDVDCPLPPLLCPPAFLSPADPPPLPYEALTLPCLRPPQRRFPERGPCVEVPCPCGTSITLLCEVAKERPFLECIKCARFLLGAGVVADRLLAKRAESKKTAEPKPVPLLPEPRRRIGATDAEWTIEKYDEIPFGDEVAIPRVVVPGCRLGKLTVGPELPYRRGVHHARCVCGFVGYAWREDLETGKILSCPACQPYPPLGEISDVPLASWDRLVRFSRGRVVVWCSALWCGPDRLYRETLEGWAKQRPDVRLLRLDVDTAPDLVKRLRVVAAPSLLFFYAGLCQQLLVGLSNSEKISRIAQASGFDDLPPPVQGSRPTEGVR